MTQNNLVKKHNIFIGIDVDKTNFSFSIKDASNRIRSMKIAANPENLYNYIRKTFNSEKVLCAYEAGPTGFRLHDYLTERRVPCFVVSPLSIPKPPNERVKNNRIDSKKLAECLEAGQLKSIRVPKGAYRELRNLVKIRENSVYMRKLTKQRIKALVLSESLPVEEPKASWTHRYIENLKQIQCSFAVRHRLDMLLMDLEYSRKQTLSINKQLKSFCKMHTELDRDIKYLDSIPGIGFIIAVTILGKIGNPAELTSLRQLAAFTGLVPCEYSTGDTVNKGPITHLGDKNLRFLMIEAAWIAIRKDTELNQFYHRIKNRHHAKAGSKKAIVAVARKLTQRIYRVLKDQRMYTRH